MPTTAEREGDYFVLASNKGKFKFREADKLSERGAACDVFRGVGLEGLGDVAVKFDDGSHQVYREFNCLRKIGPLAGCVEVMAKISEVEWSGRPRDVLVTRLLGRSLDSICREQGCLHPATVCTIAIQALDILERLHSRGYVHRDIKPANLLLSSATAPKLALVDFGITLSLEKEEFRQRQPSGGTALFSHIGATKQHPLSPRDDLEALLYTLLFLTTGTLPWEGDSAGKAKKQGPTYVHRQAAAATRGHVGCPEQCARISASGVLRRTGPRQTGRPHRHIRLRRPERRIRQRIQGDNRMRLIRGPSGHGPSGGGWQHGARVGGAPYCQEDALSASSGERRGQRGRTGWCVLEKRSEGARSAQQWWRKMQERVQNHRRR